MPEMDGQKSTQMPMFVPACIYGMSLYVQVIICWSMWLLFEWQVINAHGIPHIYKTGRVKPNHYVKTISRRQKSWHAWHPCQLTKIAINGLNEIFTQPDWQRQNAASHLFFFSDSFGLCVVIPWDNNNVFVLIKWKLHFQFVQACTLMCMCKHVRTEKE